ncbi:MAG: hypothetical protein E5W38_00275 [Mesorhizobium sp.]|uniref:sarcosine oxidase subunit gamma n=1 Tax=Mesorhizobium sp. TaxID=1871066 RepID=UPI000FEA74FB|nr:hypothetical protein [Mesorhizobium sp.]RWA88211.1 MAG: hypothetical protein EOQ31_21995 [Mesorhizobium sp.]RWB58663.1 MAG: hypothetical protein EOQ48_21280 [Mesorhizobium sp.]TIU35787.1 MAG: hypothetical protein E5W38_00275 [Mesorhizobium sp.]TIV04669.1 MAG: hypothetical protein E5W04_02510 [Mesorhizobium sp.]
MASRLELAVGCATSDDRDVTINEIELGYLTQLAGWGKFNERANEALRAKGLALPDSYRLSVQRASMTVWRIAPDRVLVRSDAALSFENATDLAVLDLSDSRVCLMLEGPGASGLLSRVASLDFSDVAFDIGSFAQTAIHHVNVLIDHPGPDQFAILIPTTYATSLTSYLAGHLIGRETTKSGNS